MSGWSQTSPSLLMRLESIGFIATFKIWGISSFRHNFANIGSNVMWEVSKYAKINSLAEYLLYNVPFERYRVNFKGGSFFLCSVYDIIELPFYIDNLLHRTCFLL